MSDIYPNKYPEVIGQTEELRKLRTRLAEAEAALRVYEESIKDVKEWCDIDGAGCSTKWFHSVAGPGAARQYFKKWGEKP